MSTVFDAADNPLDSSVTISQGEDNYEGPAGKTIGKQSCL